MKFRDRLEKYRKRPVFPRPRGMRYNLPDIQTARINQPISDSIIAVNLRNSQSTSSTDPNSIKIQHQQIYPLSMESNTGLFSTSNNSEMYVTTVIQDDSEYGPLHDMLIFDGTMFHSAFSKSLSAYHIEPVNSDAIGINKEHQYALIFGENWAHNPNFETILRWNFNKGTIDIIKSDSNAAFSSSYIGNGVITGSTSSNNVSTNYHNIIGVPNKLTMLNNPTHIIMWKGENRQFIVGNGNFLLGTFASFWDSSTSGFLGGNSSIGLSIAIGQDYGDKWNKAAINVIGSSTLASPLLTYINQSGIKYEWQTFGSLCTSSGDAMPSSNNSLYGTTADIVNTINDIKDYDFIFAHKTESVGYFTNNRFGAAVPGVFWTSLHTNEESSLLGPYANVTDAIKGDRGLGYEFPSNNKLIDPRAGDNASVRYGVNPSVRQYPPVGAAGISYDYIAGPQKKYRGIFYEIGTYIGNGTSQTIQLPFNNNAMTSGVNRTISWIFVKGNDTTHPRWKWECHVGSSRSIAMDAGVADITNGITYMDMSSFTVGNHDDVNKSGVTYYWAAMCRDTMPFSSAQFSDIYDFGYNYEDKMLYYWLDENADVKNKTTDKVDTYGSLIKYNHNTNEMQLVLRTLYTWQEHPASQWTASGGSFYASPFGQESKIVFHPVTNRMFWTVESGAGCVWTLDGTIVSKSWNPKDWDGVVNGNFFSKKDSGQSGSPRIGEIAQQYTDDIIVFGDSIYIVKITNKFITFNNVGFEYVIFKNSAGGANTWEIDKIINTSDFPMYNKTVPSNFLFSYLEDYYPVFGTLWPDDANEPTELFLMINAISGQGFLDDAGNKGLIHPGLGIYDAEDSLSDFFNDNIFYRKSSQTAEWEFDSILTSGGSYSRDKNVYPQIEFGLTTTNSGTGISKNNVIPFEPEVFIVNNTNNTGISAIFWIPSMGSNIVSSFIDFGELSGVITNMILNGSATIVQYGSSDYINGSGKSYMVTALPKKMRGVECVASGEYGGNGISGTEIQTPFIPKMVFIKCRQGDMGWWRSDNMDEGMSVPFGEGGFTANKIISNTVNSQYKNGFTIGNDTEVNDPSKTYWWVAFADSAIVNKNWTGNEKKRIIFTDKLLTEYTFYKPDIDHHIGNKTGSGIRTFDGFADNWNFTGSDQTLFISNTSRSNMGGNRYFWSGIVTAPTASWDFSTHSSLFSIRGRMCFMVFDFYQHHGRVGLLYSGMKILSRSPDGKWGLTDYISHAGNNMAKENPQFAGDGRYVRNPEKGVTDGHIGGCVIGKYRDNNKQ